MNFEMKETQDIFGCSSLKSKAMDFITSYVSRGSTSLSGLFLISYWQYIVQNIM